MITALALKAALGGIGSRIAALARWAFDHPWQMATLALAGWLVWLHVLTLPTKDSAIAQLAQRAVAERTAHQETKRAYARAQILAGNIARAQKEAVEARYQEIADEADRQFAAGHASALAAADRYAAGRVCPSAGTSTGSSSGTAAAAPGDQGAGFPAGVPADTLVAVSLSDLRSCAGAVNYALRARKFVLGLESGR